MKKFLALLKVNILSSLSQIRMFSGKKSKKLLIGAGLLIVYFLAYISFMTYTMIDMLKPAGAQSYALLLIFISVCMMILILNIYSADSVLFGSRDNEQLFSYPLRQSTIIFSKICGMLVTSYLFTLLFCLPSFVVYAIMVVPQISFYFFAIITIIFLPLAPLAISCAISYLITLIANGTKFRTLIKMILSMVAVFGLMFLIQNFMTNKEVFNQSLTTTLMKIFPPLGFLTSTFVENSWLSLLMFVLSSVLPFVLLSILMSIFYRKIWSRSVAVNVRAKSSKFVAKKNNQLLALTKKELKKFFSSPAYMMNSAIGMLLVTIFAIASMFGGEKIASMIIAVPQDSNISMFAIVVLIVSFCVAMTCTTASSISLEGKKLWLVKTLPIDCKSYFMAKLICNWLIVVPLNILNVVILTVAFNLSLVQFALLILLPSTICLLMSTLGLLLNIKYHLFEYKSEYMVVKNSLSVMICVFGGVGLVMLGAFLFSFVGKYISIELYATIFMGIIAIAGIILLLNIMKNSKKLFENF